MLPELVFQVVLIRLFDIVGEVAEESKGWHHGWQLGDEFYFDGMPPHHRRLIALDGFQ